MPQTVNQTQAPTPDKIKIAWHLSTSQKAFFESTEFAALFVGGWGSGKTWVGSRKAFMNALNYPDTLGLISANTVKQLNQSTLVEFWKTLREDFGLAVGEDYVVGKAPPKHWHRQSRFADHNSVISFRWGAQIVTRSLSRHESILGVTLGWAWIDEARDAKRDAFNTVLSRLRCKKIPKPRLDITTSPNGFDWLYDYFESEPLEDEGKPPEKQKNLKAQRSYYVASTLDNADNLPADFVEGLESSLDGMLAQQNIHGQWVDLNHGKAYYTFARSLNVTEAAVFNSSLPVYLCCDFNATPMSWVIAQPWHRTTGAIDNLGRLPLQKEGLAVIDEIVIRDSSTPEAIVEFVDRGYGANPHMVHVYGDSSGNHSTVGASDYSIIRKAGFTNIKVKNSNPRVSDRIAAFNALLANAKGETGLIINPKCKELIRDLTQVGLKPGTRQLDKSDPDRTHTSDAVGYCVVKLWPISRARVVATTGTRM